jgi:hypothetical protein
MAEEKTSIMDRITSLVSGGASTPTDDVEEAEGEQFCTTDVCLIPPPPA